MDSSLLSSASISDPRFQWLVQKYGKPSVTNQTVSEYLESNSKIIRLQGSEFRELIVHLEDYANSFLELKVDEELFDICVAFSGSKKRIEPLLGRIGWLGERSLTLQETGDLVGVTRERIRQIEAKLVKWLESKQAWAPILAQSVEKVAELLPVSDQSFAPILQNAGILQRPVTLDGLCRAYEIFLGTQPFEVIETDGGRWLSANPVLDRETIQIVRTSAIKLASRQGIAAVAEIADELSLSMDRVPSASTIRDVVRQCRNLSLIEGDWIVPSDIEARNALRNRLRKILAVTSPVSINDARQLLEREEREERRLDITNEHIEALAGYYPEFATMQGMLSAATKLAEIEELSDSEWVAVQQIREDGGVSSFGSIERAMIRAGGSRPTASVTLRYSPVLIKPYRDTYLIAGTRIDDIFSSSRLRVQDSKETYEQESQPLPPNAVLVPVSIPDVDDNTVKQNQPFGEISIKLISDEAIFTGPIDKQRIDALLLRSRRWAALIDTETHRMKGFIRLSRLLNKQAAGINEILAYDPKLHGHELLWDATESEIDAALNQTFVVFSNREINGHIDHHVIFRSTFQQWENQNKLQH